MSITLEIGADIERRYEDYASRLGGNKESYIEQALLEKLRLMEMDLHDLEIERKIKKGLEQIDRGEGIPHEEVMARSGYFFSWIRPQVVHMKVIWSPDARSDLKEIYEYLSKDNREAAKRVINSVKEKVDLIKYAPLIGKSLHRTNSRSLVLGTYPYTIYYQVGENQISISAIIHDARIIY